MPDTVIDAEDKLHKDPVPKEFIFLYFGLRNSNDRFAIYLTKTGRGAGLRVKS